MNTKMSREKSFSIPLKSIAQNDFLLLGIC